MAFMHKKYRQAASVNNITITKLSNAMAKERQETYTTVPTQKPPSSCPLTTLICINSLDTLSTMETFSVLQLTKCQKVCLQRVTWLCCE